MDLFRRIFGKSTDEAVTEQPAAQKKTDEIKSSPADTPLPEAKETEPVEQNKSIPVDSAVEDDLEETPTVRIEGDLLNKEEEQVDDESFSPLDPATRPVGPPPPPKGRMYVPDGVTQPLNPDLLTINKTEHLLFGQTSDVGLVRSNNQDAAVSFYFTSHSADDLPDIGLFVVADGMGGHHDGEKASALTTKILAEKVTRSIYMPAIAQHDNTEELIPTSEALVSAVKEANQEVLKHVPEGGTTVTAVVVIGDLAHIVHVGDSRAYLITKDGIEQLTRDHSLVQRLIELDQLTPEEAEVHPQKNVLYRALGQNESLEVDVATRRLPQNARLLICSDGLWGQVEERELYEVSMNDSDPQQACDKLVALANTRGGVDNITAILLRIL